MYWMCLTMKKFKVVQIAKNYQIIKNYLLNHRINIVNN